MLRRSFGILLKSTVEKIETERKNGLMREDREKRMDKLMQILRQFEEDSKNLLHQVP